MITKQENKMKLLLIPALFLLMLPVGFAQTLGSELVTNGGFVSERPHNVFNFTFNDTAWTDSQPLPFSIDYFQTAVYGKAMKMRNAALDIRFTVLKVPIQNASAQRNLTFVINNSLNGGDSPEISIVLGFQNNNFSSGGIGESVNFIIPTNDFYITSTDLGNGFSLFNMNVSEEYFGIAEPEHTINAVFLYDEVNIGFGRIVGSPIDNVTMIEDGTITFFEDFEQNLPLSWSVCDFTANDLFCDIDSSDTTSFITPDFLLNFTQNSGDSEDITSQNFTIAADTTYRLTFRWNSTTLDPDINNGGSLCLIFSATGMNILCLGYNDTFSDIISSGNGGTVISTANSDDGNMNVVTVDFTSDTTRQHRIDFLNYQTDTWYLVDSVSIREVIPAEETGITGTSATIVIILGLVVAVGILGLTVRELLTGNTSIERLIKVVVGIIIGIVLLISIMAFI